jgi:hypothetical protein
MLLCREDRPDKSVVRKPSTGAGPGKRTLAAAPLRRGAPHNGETRDLAESSRLREYGSALVHALLLSVPEPGLGASGVPIVTRQNPARNDTQEFPDMEVDCVALDVLLSGAWPTLFKRNIEGAGTSPGLSRLRLAGRPPDSSAPVPGCAP